MKWTPLLILILSSTQVFAEEISDDCLHCMQKVYQFYYYEIQPKTPAEGSTEKMGENSLSKMQTVVGELKASCSPQLVAKMNQFLQEDKG